MRRLLLLVSLAAPACGDASDEPVTPVEVDFFDRLADPYAPARRPLGQARVSSSRRPEPRSGFQNDDWAHYERIEGDLGIVLDERGPGVLTRLWLTQRSTRSAPAVEEDLAIRMWVDGEPIEWAPDREEVGLRELTSGTLPAFPRPWVAGPAEASGSFLVTVPLQFQEGIRIALRREEGLDAYWWIDWHSLPRGSVVRSFDGTLTDEERDALERATRRWVDDQPLPTASTSGAREIAPGEIASIDQALRGVLRSVAVDPVTVASLEVELLIDGTTVAAAPADRLFLAAPPAGPHRSALHAFDGARGVLRFPTPVREAIRLVFRNRSDEPVTVAWALEWDEGEPPESLGDLRIDCALVVGVEGTNAVLAELAGPGHVAGHTLTVVADGWDFTVLEGDPEILADDRALLGTGIEDLFGGAHYFIYGPFAEPEHGLAGMEGGGSGYPRLSMYRHAIASGVDFDRSLRWTYEVFDPGSTFDACTYWYAD